MKTHGYFDDTEQYIVNLEKDNSILFEENQQLKATVEFLKFEIDKLKENSK